MALPSKVYGGAFVGYEEDVPSSAVLWQEAQRQLASQMDVQKQIEAKANLVAAFAGFAATNVYVSWKWPNCLLMLLEATAIILTFVFAYQALLPRGFANGTKLKFSLENHLTISKAATEHSLTIAAAEDWEHNRKANLEKAWFFKWELTCFMAAVLFIVAGKFMG